MHVTKDFSSYMVRFQRQILQKKDEEPKTDNFKNYQILIFRNICK